MVHVSTQVSMAIRRVRLGPRAPLPEDDHTPRPYQGHCRGERGTSRQARTSTCVQSSRQRALVRRLIRLSHWRSRARSKTISSWPSDFGLQTVCSPCRPILRSFKQYRSRPNGTIARELPRRRMRVHRTRPGGPGDRSADAAGGAGGGERLWPSRRPGLRPTDAAVLAEIWPPLADFLRDLPQLRRHRCRAHPRARGRSSSASLCVGRRAADHHGRLMTVEGSDGSPGRRTVMPRPGARSLDSMFTRFRDLDGLALTSAPRSRGRREAARNGTLSPWQVVRGGQNLMCRSSSSASVHPPGQGGPPRSARVSSDAAREIGRTDPRSARHGAGRGAPPCAQNALPTGRSPGVQRGCRDRRTDRIPDPDARPT